ncbi:hypothetical protein BDB00DRAFT_837444 [Zychaea mexicana]|uniref:uncharacterized protein n=1 Tax=Zychaea mexicana TaxID=64656 RepID=UPI0022FEFD21|nr:uncharacterized protein BDB00DRAFT_837444 [Zychaea mexicana]KAI9490503.1 hypothetical protein BDB00DRAFT_837444 [Zychaea mexicana]
MVTTVETTTQSVRTEAVEAPALSPPLASSNTNHIGFTEFRLDPLDAHATPPHQLRESCRTFTLNLEPTPGTPLAQSFKKFQDCSYSTSGPNRAHDTTPHISILGKVTITRGDQSQWRTADRLHQIISQQVQLLDMLTAPIFGGYQTISKPTRALVMHVHVDADFAKLARSIHRLMTPEQGVNFQTIPPMNRIYLAYDILHSLSPTTLSKLNTLAKETIVVDDWVLHGQDWQLSLYEVILESRVKGIQQQAVLIDSWQLNKPQSNTAPSTPWLSKSLRVKLAVLSTRCFGPRPSASTSTSSASANLVSNSSTNENEIESRS